MPIPGWIDTGLLLNYALQLDVSLRQGGNYASLILIGSYLPAQWSLYNHSPGTNSCPAGTFMDGGNGGAAVTLRLKESAMTGGGAEHDLLTGASICNPPFWADQRLLYNAGPFKLGATIENASGVRNMRYAIFGYELTRAEWTIGGFTQLNTTPFPVAALASAPAVQFGFDAFLVPVILPPPMSAYRYGNFVADGLSLTLDGFMGNADFVVNGQYFESKYNLVGATRFFGSFWHFLLDVDVKSSAGISQFADFTATQPTSALVAPYQQAHRITNASWGPNPTWDGKQSLALTTPYVTAQDPVIPVGERPLQIRHVPPKRPTAAPSSWSPITLQLASQVPVLLSSNSWAPTGPVTVSGAGGSTWTVTGGGASVARTLASTWRDRVGLGTGGTGNPAYVAFSFRKTKHESGEDVWGWAAYAYLEVGITAPSAGTLTMTLTGVYLGVNEATGAGTGTTAWSKSYNVPVLTGANTVRVDLLFPADLSGAFYPDRVDTIAFSALAVGTYTLTSLRLLAVEQGYLKVDHSGQMPGIVYAQDGSFAFGNLGGQPLIPAGGGETFKDFETGEFGGSIPIRALDAGGAILNDRTLVEIAADLNAIEGFTASYNGAAMEADLTDGSNTLTEGRRGEWLDPVEPSSRMAGDTSALIGASPLIHTYQLVPGVLNPEAPVFRIPGRAILGGTVEAVMQTAGGLRAGSGLDVKLIRTDTSAVVAGGATDGSGYVEIPVGADATRIYQIQ